MSSEDIYKIVEMMNDRITDLQKSYRVLNDHSQTQEIEIVKINTKLDTIASIIKFFITPGVALLVVVQVARLAGVPI